MPFAPQGKWIRAHQLTRLDSHEIYLRPNGNYNIRDVGAEEPSDEDVSEAFVEAEMCAKPDCPYNIAEPFKWGPCIVNQTGISFPKLTPAQQKLLLAVCDTGLQGYELMLPRGDTARALRDNLHLIERLAGSHLVTLTEAGGDVVHSQNCEDCASRVHDPAVRP